MRQNMLALANASVVLAVLGGCGSGNNNPNAAGTNIRQSAVTISSSPIFPYDPLTANQYSLLVSNHSEQDLSLSMSQILSTSLTESFNLSDVVDSSDCQELLAGSNCLLSVKLPYVKNNGYINFKLNYQDKLHTKDYPLSKLLAFTRDIPESNALRYSLKHLEQVVVNSDKFTLALPLSLQQDYAKIELQLADRPANTYNEISCDSHSYSNHSNCTAIVELDGHLPHPQLSLVTTDYNGSQKITKLNLNVVFNNTAHLVYLNAPAVVRADAKTAESVTVVNIGTAEASKLAISRTPTTGIDLTYTSTCSAKLGVNDSCSLSYGQVFGAAGEIGTQQQLVDYFGGAQGVQRDKFNIYRSAATLVAPKIDQIYPKHNQIVDESKPIITVSFTQPVDSSTVNDSSFYVTQSPDDTTHLKGNIAFSATNTLSFTPSSALSPGATYQIHLKTGALGNRAGNISIDPNETKVTEFKIKQPAQVAISPDSATEIVMGDSFRFSATIDVGSSTINAKFVNSALGVITPSSSPCKLNATGIKSCSFNAVVIGYELWNTTLNNGGSSDYKIVLEASDNAQLSTDSLSFKVITPTIFLPSTGQTVTLPLNPAPEGSDGFNPTGVSVSKRFTKGTGLAANCITDNLTGLMWPVNANLFGQNGWADALSAVAKMNSNSGATGYNLCGHNDWHLPTVNELISLVNYSYGTLDWLNMQGFVNIQAISYWSSTSYAPDNNLAWDINFFNGGNVNAANKNYTNYVWPVRRVL